MPHSAQFTMYQETWQVRKR